VAEIDGLSITRLHPNNTGGAKSLLAWDCSRKSKSSQSLSPPPKDSEEAVEGGGGVEDGRFLIKGYHWSDQKQKQYAGVCPYGISEAYERYDAVAENKKKEAALSPKSLGSFVAKQK
jgi:hypothetical protein